MSELPIKGEGLDAIIRATTGDDFVFETGGEELKREIEKLRGRLEEALKREEAAVSSLESRLAEREEEIGRLREELRGLRKITGDEFPQGAARDLMIDTLREKAEEFDRAGNLLDSFHLYRRVLRLDPANIDALYQIATAYYSAGLKKKAVECLRAILEIDPSQERAAESLEAIEEEL